MQFHNISNNSNNNFIGYWLLRSPPPGPVRCRQLLVRLQGLQTADDEAIFGEVEAVVEPLPVLQRTLQYRVDGLDDLAMRAAGEDVLLVLHSEHLCTSVSGRPAPAVAATGSFVPLVAAAHATSPCCAARVVCIREVCCRWVVRWGLSGIPAVEVPWPPVMAPATDALLVFCLTFPAPPVLLSSYLRPPVCRARDIRAVRLWLSHIFSALHPALLAAASGMPVHVRFSCTAVSLAPLSEWLRSMAQEAEETLNCFSCEFNSCIQLGNGHVLRTLCPAQKKKASIVLLLWLLRLLRRNSVGSRLEQAVISTIIAVQKCYCGDNETTRSFSGSAQHRSE